MTFTMKRFAHVASAVVLAAFSAGCAMQFGRADHDASVRSKNDAYVVIGLEPENASIAIFQGSIRDNRYRQNPLPPATFAGYAEQGYVVTRVSPETAYAITFVTLYASKFEPITGVMVPCNGAKTLVFTVPAGTALYMGSVRFRTSGAGIVPQYSHDYDAAKAFLNGLYPKLAPSLSDGKPQFLPVDGIQCAGGR